MRKPGGDYTNIGTKKTDIKGGRTGIGQTNFFGESQLGIRKTNPIGMRSIPQFRLMSDRVTTTWPPNSYLPIVCPIQLGIRKTNPIMTVESNDIYTDEDLNRHAKRAC